MTLSEICEKHKDEIPEFLERWDMSSALLRFNDDVYCEMDLKLP